MDIMSVHHDRNITLCSVSVFVILYSVFYRHTVRNLKLLEKLLRTHRISIIVRVSRSGVSLTNIKNLTDVATEKNTPLDKNLLVLSLPCWTQS